jgi:hypothetical protein
MGFNLCYEAVTIYRTPYAPRFEFEFEFEFEFNRKVEMSKAIFACE